MTDDVKRTVVQLDYDQGSGKRVEAGVDRLTRRFVDLRTETRIAKVLVNELSRGYASQEKASASLARDTKKLASSEGQFNREIKKTTKSLKDQKREIADAADSVKDYDARLKGIRDKAGTYGDVETGIRGVTGAIGYLGGGDIERTVNIGSELLAATEGAKRLSAELPALTKQMGLANVGVGKLTLGVGVVGLAVAGAAIALDALHDATKRTREEAQCQIEIERQVQDLDIRGKTTEELRELREELVATVEATEESIRSLDARRTNVDRNMSDAEFVAETASQAVNKIPLVGNTLSNFIFGGGGLQDFDSEIQGLHDQVDTTVDVIGEVDRAFGSSATAANDAEAAEEDLAEARQKTYEATLNLVDKQVADTTRLRRAVETATVEQVDDQIAEYESQIQAYRDEQVLLTAQFTAGKLTSQEYNDEIQKLDDAIQDVQFKIADWNTLVRDAAEGRELETNALKLHKRVLSDHVEAQDKYQAAVNAAAEAAEEYADTLAKRNLQLAQDAEKFALERTRDLADHYAEMAELDRDYYAERGDIMRDMRGDLVGIDQEQVDELADLNDDLQALARDHADSMRDIERDANRDIQNSAARFNAWGVFQAELDRRAALEDEQQQWDLEDQQRTTHYSHQSGKTVTHYANLEGMIDTHLANMENRFAASLGRMAATANTSLASRSRVAGNRALPAYKDGGYPQVGRDVIVGDGGGPEVARFLQPVRIYPNGVTPPGGFGGGGSVQIGDININVPPGSGADLHAIGAVVRDELIAVLDGVGRN